MSKRLIELGYDVYSTDLVDRGYGFGGIDFLQCEDIFNGDILTNPPYKYAQEFVEHALGLVKDGHKVFMFLKLTFLEGQKRRELFNRKELKHVYVASKRLNCIPNGDLSKAIKSSAVAYAWFEFQKGYNGYPTLSWIN